MHRTALPFNTHGRAVAAGAERACEMMRVKMMAIRIERACTHTIVPHAMNHQQS